MAAATMAVNTGCFTVVC